MVRWEHHDFPGCRGERSVAGQEHHGADARMMGGFSVPARVMRFRPCIDLHGGVVKQVWRAENEQSELYAAPGLSSCLPSCLWQGNMKAPAPC